MKLRSRRQAPTHTDCTGSMSVCVKLPVWAHGFVSGQRNQLHFTLHTHAKCYCALCVRIFSAAVSMLVSQNRKELKNKGVFFKSENPLFTLIRRTIRGVPPLSQYIRSPGAVSAADTVWLKTHIDFLFPSTYLLPHSSVFDMTIYNRGAAAPARKHTALNSPTL